MIVLSPFRCTNLIKSLSLSNLQLSFSTILFYFNVKLSITSMHLTSNLRRRFESKMSPTKQRNHNYSSSLKPYVVP